ncbi:DUF397 domain-containing protein [Streptomyces sp. WMMB303]|uniref:DUF397 domain-containing protein n=1 Tax=Streptomyces sp. WMMB303 TaxID=3034154 RepID=UPI0023EE27B3|nr:DUF397 domain-containing protein [Streptomyces sp. WMMB303]MDF4252782.1 DUF397 domain-containing protein [Streptomyces sp. WMMB303]
MTVQPHPNSTQWRKSSYSNGDGGDCVEVAVPAQGGVVTVRDTKAGPRGQVLTFPAPQWGCFVATVCRGGFEG